MDMEEKFASLQEEAGVKTTRLKETWREFQRTREEVYFIIHSKLLNRVSSLRLGTLPLSLPLSLSSCPTRGLTLSKRRQPCRRR